MSGPPPTLEWQVVGACNYACAYCIQSPRRRRGVPSRAQVERAVDHLVRLPGTWEAKLSGGEVFAWPGFLDHLLPALVARTPHRISVLTNFSASPRDLMRFVDRVGDRVVVFSASLHPDAVEVAAFVDQAAWFRDLLPPGASFVVNQVVLPGREAAARACRDQVEARGLAWFPQLLKTGGGVAAYPDPAVIEDLLGDRRANRAPSFRGRSCHAGAAYFTVDRDGKAWACRAARRVGEGFLGDLHGDGVRLRAGPEPCPYDLCPCTVPAHRGMVA